MNVKDFDYALPEELIAQDPLPDRSASRLLIMDIDSGALFHRHFYDITSYLRPGDCLVINDTRVIPARLLGVKEGTGAHAELLLLRREQGDVWECLARPGKKLREETRISFGDGMLTAEVLSVSEDGNRHVRFFYEGIFEEVLDRLGEMPLPPYIRHKLKDKNRYQTVYAEHDGSAAAPTAGLHFTKELLQRIEEMGVRIAHVTLHVGLGTFRPVKAETVEDHHMHSEYFVVTEETAELVNRTIASGGRIVSVGTTSTRTLESAAVKNPAYETLLAELQDRRPGSPAGIEDTAAGCTHPETGKASVRKACREGKECLVDASGRIVPKYILKAQSGWTEIFIYPGYEWKLVDALITNFHLPESTLVMLVSSLSSREKVLAAYQTAVEKRYRFFSFGDACFFARLSEAEKKLGAEEAPQEDP